MKALNCNSASRASWCVRRYHNQWSNTINRNLNWLTLFSSFSMDLFRPKSNFLQKERGRREKKNRRDPVYPIIRGFLKKILFSSSIFNIIRKHTGHISLPWASLTTVGLPHSEEGPMREFQALQQKWWKLHVKLFFIFPSVPSKRGFSFFNFYWEMKKLPFTAEEGSGQTYGHMYLCRG